MFSSWSSFSCIEMAMNLCWSLNAQLPWHNIPEGKKQSNIDNKDAIGKTSKRERICIVGLLLLLLLLPCCSFNELLNIYIGIYFSTCQKNKLLLLTVNRDIFVSVFLLYLYFLKFFVLNQREFLRRPMLVL